MELVLMIQNVVKFSLNASSPGARTKLSWRAIPPMNGQPLTHHPRYPRVHAQQVRGEVVVEPEEVDEPHLDHGPAHRRHEPHREAGPCPVEELPAEQPRHEQHRVRRGQREARRRVRPGEEAAEPVLPGEKGDAAEHRGWGWRARVDGRVQELIKKCEIEDTVTNPRK